MQTTLVVGHIQDFISVAQRDPFLYNRHHLHRQLDLNIKYVRAETFTKVAEACKKYASEMYFSFTGIEKILKKSKGLLKKYEQTTQVES